jgi:hypothetical protein
MGMFDEIKCLYPLPGATKEVQEGVFQTKDFDNAMDNYTITEDGRLILHEKVYEHVPEEERPYYGKPEWEKPIFRIFGCLKSTPIGDKEIPYHGYINIYTTCSFFSGDPYAEWFEYEIKFTDGKVESVERLKNNVNE